MFKLFGKSMQGSVLTGTIFSVKVIPVTLEGARLLHKIPESLPKIVKEINALSDLKFLETGATEKINEGLEMLVDTPKMKRLSGNVLEISQQYRFVSGGKTHS